jgi:nitrate reductase NapE component
MSVDQQGVKSDESVLKKMTDYVVDAVKKHPVRAAAVVGGIGLGAWLLGRWMKSRKNDEKGS